MEELNRAPEKIKLVEEQESSALEDRNNSRAKENRDEEYGEHRYDLTVEEKGTEFGETESHRVALESVKRHLPAERADELRTELAQIDNLKQNTYEVREAEGNVTLEEKKLAHRLALSGVVPDNFTIDELKSIDRFISSEDEESVNERVDCIRTTVQKMNVGARGPRIWNNREGTRQRIDELKAKAVKAEREGMEAVMERGFDIDRYLGEDTTTPEYADREFGKAMRDLSWANEGLNDPWSDLGSQYADDQDLEDYAESRNKRDLLENEDVDTLLDLGIIEDDDVYTDYGYYTSRDIRDIDAINTTLWADPTSNRDKLETAEILKQYVLDTHGDLMADMVRQKVAREVLPKRRPNLRNMVAMLCSMGDDYAKYKESHKKQEDKELAAVDRKIKRNFRESTNYLLKIFPGIFPDRDYLKQEYGYKCPTSKEFYEDALAKIEAMPQKELDYITKNEFSFITKLDQHLYEIEDRYVKLSKGKKTKETSTEPKPTSMLGAIIQNMALGEAKDEKSE